ncbi:PPC domain-containing protein [Maricaulis sp.]|uniref:PPC domain-containing protein n=1 Tax=Maricaulis sp. TaxID=1486257 RepID=UPI0025C0CF7B|nr:PPC domain-containing protein [Maricaulis sp.]
MRVGYVLGAFVCLAGSAVAQAADDRVVAGEVTEQAARSLIEVDFEAGQIVTLTTQPTGGFDTVLELLDPNGRPVAENDDREPGDLSSQITYLAEQSGRYTAVVTGYGGATGAFDLVIAEGVEFGLSSEARILSEASVTLERDRPAETYPVELAVDDILVVTTYALTDGLDTTLTLISADGTIIAQNDDRGDGSLNSQLVFQAPEAGRYTVELGTFDAASFGDLVLSVAIDPNAEVPFDFDSIERTPFAEYDGTIGGREAEFDYPIELAAGETLLAIAEAVTGDLDTVLRLVGADGNPVALNDDRGDGSLNSAIAFTAPETATYTLELRRYRSGESSGDFRLELSLVDASVAETLQELLENRVSLSGPELTVMTPDFRVLYTLEGVDASSTEYAQSVGDALQEMLDSQVSRIGWAEPVRDDDGRYRAYVADADGSMGVTYPVQIVFDNSNTSDVRETAAARTVFVIDNDFVGMGKAASVHSLMRATATHEFNHVIQFGYDSEEGLDWLYEATASWTETTTVGSDQDATDYVETDFAAPEVCWTTSQDGFDYSQWTLLQSMADVYGEGIVVTMWENSVALDGFETMAATLEPVGTTIPDVISRWRAQNYALAYDLAPMFNSTVRVQHTLSSERGWMSKGGLEQLGANYITVALDGVYEFSLRGDDGLDLFALAQDGDRIQVIPLGQGGVVDTTAHDHVALMVFNRTMPEAPGVCSDVGYSLDVAPAMTAPASPAYSFSAEHFTAPG